MSEHIGDTKVIVDALIKASNATETEWLEIEKVAIKNLSKNSNSESVKIMWDNLHHKIMDSIERIKNQ